MRFAAGLVESFAAGVDACAAGLGAAATGAFAVRRERRETRWDPEDDVVDDEEARVSGS